MWQQNGPLEYYKQSQSGRKKLRTTWFHSYAGYKTETHRHIQQYGGYWREGDLGIVKGKGGHVYGDEDYLNLVMGT